MENMRTFGLSGEDAHVRNRWRRKLMVNQYSHTWLRAIEADLGPLNFGIATAWRKAATRDTLSNEERQDKEYRHKRDFAAEGNYG